MGGLIQGFAGLAELFSFSEAELYALFAIFVRTGAVAGLLPGFGEHSIPVRVKLAAALAFTAIVAPAVLPGLDLPEAPQVGEAAEAPFAVGRLFLAEAAAGLLLGLAVRFMVFALQLAGSMAAQVTSVAQIFGGGATPDPMPALGNMLVMAGIALALASGLEVKAVSALMRSYLVLPFGVFPVAGDLAEWGVARASSMFTLAFALASPFICAALVYNVALGAINRAMPQLMVAMIGAPAITAGALLLMLLSAPVALLHWNSLLDIVLNQPFAPAP